MSTPSARLVHEFTYHALVGAPHDVGAGPFGHRRYYDVKSGVLDGLRLKGRQIGSGGDWMLVGVDGFMRMDVRIQIETDDGAIVCARYFGPTETNNATARAFAESKSTEYTDQANRSHWLLETGDLRYAWVNQSVFVGEGRLLPGGPNEMGFEHRVYRVG